MKAAALLLLASIATTPTHEVDEVLITVDGLVYVVSYTENGEHQIKRIEPTPVSELTSPGRRTGIIPLKPTGCQ